MCMAVDQRPGMLWLTLLDIKIWPIRLWCICRLVARHGLAGFTPRKHRCSDFERDTPHAPIHTCLDYLLLYHLGTYLRIIVTRPHLQEDCVVQIEKKKKPEIRQLLSVPRRRHSPFPRLTCCQEDTRWRANNSANYPSRSMSKANSVARPISILD